MESALSDAIVSTLQQLKVGTYDSIRECDRRYSLDTYKAGIRSMETRGQLKRMVFQVGKSERYIWLLPWFDDDAQEKLQELKDEVFAYLDTTPSTSKQIRDHFKNKLPPYHQICFLVLRDMALKGEVEQITFNDERWVTIYYLPNRKELLNGLTLKALDYVNANGSAFPQDLSESLNIPRSLASALLAKLAHDNNISRIKIGWSYTRSMPIFAYCKEGHETEAVSRYNRLAHKRLIEVRRGRLVEEYMSKFRGACDKMKVNESLADLAGSYFGQVVVSSGLKGRPTAVVAWACFFLAGRILKQGITLEEIWTYGKVQRKLVLSTTKELNEFLQLSVSDLFPRASDYVSRIVVKLQLSSRLLQSRAARQTELIDEASRVLTSLPREVSFGRKAQGVAAVAVYLAAQRLRITEASQRKVARAANITDVSLRNILKPAEIAFQTDEEPPDHRKRPRLDPSLKPKAGDELKTKNLLDMMIAK